MSVKEKGNSFNTWNNTVAQFPKSPSAVWLFRYYLSAVLLVTAHCWPVRSAPQMEFVCSFSHSCNRPEPDNRCQPHPAWGHYFIGTTEMNEMDFCTNLKCIHSKYDLHCFAVLVNISVSVCIWSAWWTCVQHTSSSLVTGCCSLQMQTLKESAWFPSLCARPKWHFSIYQTAAYTDSIQQDVFVTCRPLVRRCLATAATVASFCLHVDLRESVPLYATASVINCRRTAARARVVFISLYFIRPQCELPAGHKNMFKTKVKWDDELELSYITILLLRQAYSHICCSLNISMHANSGVEVNKHKFTPSVHPSGVLEGPTEHVYHSQHILIFTVFLQQTRPHCCDVDGKMGAEWLTPGSVFLTSHEGSLRTARIDVPFPANAAEKSESQRC